MTIGALAECTGVATSAIRYWEQIGVLPRPSRTSGRREYGPDDVSRVHVLRLAQSCGLRLDEMKQLLHGFEPGVPASRRWQTMARRKKADLDDQIERLKTMRAMMDRVAKCRCGDLLECGRKAAAALQRGA